MLPVCILCRGVACILYIIGVLPVYIGLLTVYSIGVLPVYIYRGVACILCRDVACILYIIGVLPVYYLL